MSHSLEQPVPSEDTVAFDAADMERAVVLRQQTMDFADLVAVLKNTSLDWPSDHIENSSVDSSSDLEINYEEVLAENVELVVVGIKGLHKLLEECRGKLASDDHDDPLPYVLAVAMCDAMHKFLDNVTIVVAALDVIALMWDTHILKTIVNIDSMPSAKNTIKTMVFIGQKLFGNEWFAQTKSRSMLRSMTNTGPDHVTQVLLDRHLATAYRLMQGPITPPREHEVVECAVLLHSVVFYHQMAPVFEDHYVQMVSRFALWLVMSFQSEDRKQQHIGVLGCGLMHQLAVRNLEVGQVQDPVQFRHAVAWFRKKDIPGCLMIFKGFSEKGDKYIRDIELRMPPAEPKPPRKRDREPSPEASSAHAAAAARAGGSA